jgi:hypothetical protein
VEATLDGLYGSSAPITVVNAPQAATYSAGRIMGGENLKSEYLGPGPNEVTVSFCTTGYGAYHIVKRPNGDRDRVEYLLTAGHCAPMGYDVKKSFYPRGTDNFSKIGVVRLKGNPGGQHYETDAEAIYLQGIAAPTHIYRPGAPVHPVNPAGWMHPGNSICFSGVKTGSPKCGPAIGIRAIKLPPRMTAPATVAPG